MLTRQQVDHIIEKYSGLPPARSLEESILIAQQLLVFRASAK